MEARKTSREDLIRSNNYRLIRRIRYLFKDNPEVQDLLNNEENYSVTVSTFDSLENGAADKTVMWINTISRFSDEISLKVQVPGEPIIQEAIHIYQGERPSLEVSISEIGKPQVRYFWRTGAIRESKRILDRLKKQLDFNK